MCAEASYTSTLKMMVYGNMDRAAEPEDGKRPIAIVLGLGVNGLGVVRCLAAAGDQVVHSSYALQVCLVTMLAGGFTMMLLYVETHWWILALPVCLYRAAENDALNRAHKKLKEPPNCAL